MDAITIRQAAYVISQAMCALAEIEAMKAQNQAVPGSHAPKDFLAIPEHYGLYHNQVMTTLYEGS